MRSYWTTYYKYIEINCDILLNDEVFDEDGTPSGGDGKVYSWKKFDTTYFSNAKIYGNGHSVIGCYYNGTAGTISPFGEGPKVVVKNLHTKNVYLSAGRAVSGLCYSGTIENCSVSGVVKGTEMVSGICYGASTIKNTINYARVVCTGNNVHGITYSATEIDNCKNYGKISGGKICGIAASVTKMTNCMNYGTIFANAGDYKFSGIGGGRNIIGCINYGMLCSTSGAAWSAGGICASADSGTNIINCRNYGLINVTGWEVGEILGVARSLYATKDEVEFNIKSCLINSNSNKPILGYMATDAKHKQNINIDGCSYYSSKDFSGYIISRSSEYSKQYWTISDLYIQIESALNTTLFNGITAGSFVFNGVICRYNSLDGTTSKIYSSFHKNCKITFRSAVLFQSDDNNVYYGEDFSCFYLSWKTGKIGLKAIDGVGFYQGKVTEELLEAKGYEKREV